MKFIEYLKRRSKNKTFLGIIIAFTSISFGIGVNFVFLKKTRNAIMAFCFMLFALVALLLEHFLKIEFPPLFLALAFVLALGGLTGTVFDFYHKYPNLDLFLHCLSGFLFSCLGFTLCTLFLKNYDLRRLFNLCLTFGLLFSLTIALLWELFEYGSSLLFNVDMNEDSFVNCFKSFALANSHNDIIVIDNIDQTIINYQNGKQYIIDGYLDLGLIDTIGDMAICFLGAIIFFISAKIDNSKSIFYKILIPKYIKE